jgi:hypothetical protein
MTHAALAPTSDAATRPEQRDRIQFPFGLGTGHYDLADRHRDDLPSSIAGIASLANCDIRHTQHQSQVHDGPDVP